MYSKKNVTILILSVHINSSNRCNDHPNPKGVEFKQTRNGKRLSEAKFIIWSGLTRNCKLRERAGFSEPG